MHELLLGIVMFASEMSRITKPGNHTVMLVCLGPQATWSNLIGQPCTIKTPIP